LCAIEFPRRNLKKEHTFDADEEGRRATISVSADCRAATDPDPRPLHHHRPPPSWRINGHSHKPYPHQNPSEETEHSKNLILHGLLLDASNEKLL